MTTREKIDNLLNNCSETYLDSIWRSLLNYHNLTDLQKFGYKVGESRYKLCRNYASQIFEIVKDGEQIMFWDNRNTTFEDDIEWNKLSTYFDEIKNKRVEALKEEIRLIEEAESIEKI